MDTAVVIRWPKRQHSEDAAMARDGEAFRDRLISSYGHEGAILILNSLVLKTVQEFKAEQSGANAS